MLPRLTRQSDQFEESLALASADDCDLRQRPESIRAGGMVDTTYVIMMWVLHYAMSEKNDTSNRQPPAWGFLGST